MPEGAEGSQASQMQPKPRWITRGLRNLRSFSVLRCSALRATQLRQLQDDSNTIAHLAPDLLRHSRIRRSHPRSARARARDRARCRAARQAGWTRDEDARTRRRGESARNAITARAATEDPQ